MTVWTIFTVAHQWARLQPAGATMECPSRRHGSHWPRGDRDSSRGSGSWLWTQDWTFQGAGEASVSLFGTGPGTGQDGPEENKVVPPGEAAAKSCLQRAGAWVWGLCPGGAVGLGPHWMRRGLGDLP